MKCKYKKNCGHDYCNLDECPEFKLKKKKTQITGIEKETLMFEIEYKINNLTEEEANYRLIAITNLIGLYIEGMEGVSLISKT